MEIDYVRVYQESTSSAAPHYSKPKITPSPNPAQDQLTIQSARKAVGSVLIIYDAQGRLMSQQQIREQQMQINVSSWTPGTYFVQHERRQTFTLIKQ